MPDSAHTESHESVPPGVIRHDAPNAASFSQSPPAEPVGREGRSAFEQITVLLRESFGVDFSHYRRTTVLRRIARRMALCKCPDFESYRDRVVADSSERAQLHDDLLLAFTGFFRDPQIFKELAQQVFPQLVEGKSPRSAIRIWVAGCSTGEEVYSLSIALYEYLEQLGVKVPVQFFGTDLVARHIAVARGGVYPEKIHRQVSRERLERFFDVVPNGYRVTRHIREMCVFAVQNMVTDPPFPRVDLISCRNVLIYFDATFQQTVIPLFHFALNPSGFLLLGSSESMVKFSDLFYPLDERCNLYVRHDVRSPLPRRIPTWGTGMREESTHVSVGSGGPVPNENSDVEQRVSRLLAEHYAPAGVLVDSSLQIRLFRGGTSRYLEPCDGEASLKLSRMAREGLMPDLSIAIEEVRRSRATVTKENVSYCGGDGLATVTLTVIPLDTVWRNEPGFLVLFEEPRPEPVGTVGSTVGDRAGESEETQRLRKELAASKNHLQSIIEDKDNVNQELWATNEELQSTNEELQSVNEELEAAKEELESGNEELLALNEELRINNDLLARKERALRESQSFLAAVFTSIQDGICVLDRDLIVRKVNPAMERWYAPSLPLVGKKCHSCYHGNDFPCDPCPTLRALRSGNTEYNIVPGLPGSSIEWLELFSYPIHDEETGEVSGVVEFKRDISERTRAERALRASERRWQFAVDGSGLGLWDWDIESERVYYSRQWKEMLGYGDAEIGNSISEWESRIHPDDISDVKKAVAAHLDGSTQIYSCEHRQRCKDGSWKWILDRGKVVEHTPSGSPCRMIGTQTDVTGEHEMQAQLRHSEKMQAVGQLAGGIAHDFNNQLTGIQGYADLLRLEFDSHPQLREYLASMMIGIRRATELTAQLLAFSRKGKYLNTDVDLHRIIFEVVGLLQHSIDKRIVLLQQLHADPCTTVGDPTQLQSAILNLALNARDAMPDGGTLLFSTSVELLDERRCVGGAADLEPGAYLQVRVSDTGCGIDPCVRSRIFEPFFTTKEPGKGAGMGLAAVYGTVMNHHGSIVVDSAPGQGSTFTLLLPLVHSQEERGDDSPCAAAGEGSGHILLIDDEEMVRSVVTRMLELSGYTITACGSGAEGIEYYRDHADTVALVILDVVLPEMDGVEIYRRLREINPALLVLVSSGYTIESRAQLLMDSGAQGFLQKPFTRDELCAKVARVLGQAG